MTQNEDIMHDKNRSGKIKDGIARAKARGIKLGRPTIAEVKGDPYIASKAAIMRSRGLSWSQIALRLNISRSSARRLVGMCKKEDNNWTMDIDNPSMPKCDVSDTREIERHDIMPLTNDDIFSSMPKTFQIFSTLLAKAREMAKSNR